MPSRFAVAILAAALSIAPATAQIRATGAGTAGFGISAGSSGMASTGMGPGHVVGGPGRFHQGHRSERGSTVFAYPYFYSDSDYDSGEASQPPQVVVVQASAPAPPPAPPAPRESLLIEWQGDRFVRSTTSAKDSAGALIATDYSEKSAAPLSATARSAAGQKNAVQPPRELPPAVLVFHDGHKEEVSEYTIMSGTIYSKADYWTTGSWTRKIQIADLDVPATLKLNQERGLKFVLPASSNEVVTRP
jgi:hypothetical protein